MVGVSSIFVILNAPVIFFQPKIDCHIISLYFQHFSQNKSCESLSDENVWPEALFFCTFLKNSVVYHVMIGSWWTCFNKGG